ncbi:MAG: cytochrome b/b6 domain-containing protein [Acidobacteriota bacterium]
MTEDLGNEKKVRSEELVEEIIRDLERKGVTINDEIIKGVRSKVQERIKEEVVREILVLEEARRDREKKEQEEKEKKIEKKKLEAESFIRFNRNFRFQHMVLFTSVIILIITGMPMKFPDAPLMKQLIHTLGGLESSRLLHRAGASLLIFVAIYHTLYTFLSRDGRRDFLLLIPKWKDVKDFITMIKYFLGKSNEKAQFDRFSYVEKFDYWAVYWGCVIMIGSGALLWFENFSLRYLPKFILDISKEAHSDEALLATLAIVIWHFYNVHFNPSKFPGSLLWWHGRITKEEIMEEHPLEYKRLMEEGKKKREAEREQ